MLMDANLRYVLLGALLIGGTSGLLGAFAVLRRRSLVGDALAHAALPGVALAFLVSHSRSLPVLLAGATVSGVLGVLLIQFVVTHTRLKADAAIGTVLSVFFGAGIVLLTHIQRQPNGNQSGLDRFLFGQAAAIVPADLLVMSALAASILLAVLLLYKEFTALIFDAGFLQAAGYSARLLDLGLMGLIVLTVMVGLQAVGVAMVAAMLVTPAVAARFWSERLAVVVWLSVLFGAGSGAAGTYISSLAPRIPTGPVMVLVATGLFAVSALGAPRRGLVARWRQRRANALREREQHFLRAMFELEEREAASGGARTAARIAEQLAWPSGRAARLARRLARRGLVQRHEGGWELTGEGRAQGWRVVKSHRLWEHYLVHQDMLAQDHVDRSADELEHLLTPQIIERLEELLVQEQRLQAGPVTSVHATESGYRRGGRDG